MRNKEYQRLMKSGTWQRLRLSYLKAHPLCERCEVNGLTVPAEEIHHIIPIANERDYARMRRLAYDTMNLQALCRECHHKVHEEMGSRSKAMWWDRAGNKAKARKEAENFMTRFTSGQLLPGE